MASAVVAEAVDDSVRASLMEVEFRRFMSTQYSARLFLIIVIGNIFFNVATFHREDFDVSMTKSVWNNFQSVLRMSVLLCPIYIWIVKKNGCGENLSLDINDNKHERSALYFLLPYVQAAYPVMLALVLMVKILTDLPDQNSLASQTTYLPLFGLTLLPFATFFLVRDTSVPAMIFSWGLCVATLTIISYLIQSWDYVYSTICYFLVTGFIFFDTDKQNRRMFALMTKLQDALKVNEQLAVDAQALELRAMIGNVAHDLKTVLKPALVSHHTHLHSQFTLHLSYLLLHLYSIQYSL